MISHKHKFIYLHLPKTGGTSVSTALHGLCDERKFKAGHPKLRLIGGDYHLSSVWADLKLKQADYTMFTIVRNPFQRLVSAFHYLSSGISSFKSDLRFCKKHGLAKYTFPDFVKYKLNSLPPYIHFRTIIGDYILAEDIGRVDFIGRFESLQQDFDTICDKVGIPRQKLPHKNKSKHKHYTEYYDDETREIVAERYAEDIKHFGYKFGD